MSISAAWLLKDFSKQSGRITSKAFGFESWRWTLRVYPKGEKSTENHGKHFGVYLGVYSEDADVQLCGWRRHVKFSIAMQRGNNVFKKEEIRVFHAACQSRGWPQFADLAVVHEHYACNDCVYFLVEITSLEPESEREMPVLLQPVPEFRSALNNPTDSDISFQVGHQQIVAHKVILRSRSEYFRKLFASGMAESRQKLIVVEDFTPDTFLVMLEYIYVGRVDNFPHENMYEVARIADQYGVAGLREIAAQRIETNLSSANACDVLLFADKHNLTSLKNAVLEWVAARTDPVLESDGFRTLLTSGNSSLIRALFSTLAPVQSEKRRRVACHQ